MRLSWLKINCNNLKNVCVTEKKLGIFTKDGINVKAGIFPVWQRNNLCCSIIYYNKCLVGGMSIVNKYCILP